ncbi:hypothetical protein DYU05_04465 [Mucilaginibacter terrenus]|uniref:Uncharacterized protein n=1 Tax=Mucilaginibacter terrenus TaxID=2482727 RepID=A0A3E2NV34_9SPHI|nr:hypothetical protein DYU05_04465 [Mucilaginibacter terrenus]
MATLTQTQCPNCNSYKTVTDTKQKFLVYGLLWLVPGISFYYFAVKDNFDGFWFPLLLAMVIAGIIYIIRGLILKTPQHTCKNCGKIW